MKNDVWYFLLLTFWAWMLPGLVLSLPVTLLGLFIYLTNIGDLFWYAGPLVVMANAAIIVMLWLAWRYVKGLARAAREGEIPRNWLLRYLPLFVPVLWMLVVAAAVTWTGATGEGRGTHALWCGPQYWACGTYLQITEELAGWSGTEMPFNSLLIMAALVMAGAGMVFLAHFSKESSRGMGWGAGAVLAVTACMIIAIGQARDLARREVLGKAEPGTIVVREDYASWHGGTPSILEEKSVVEPESPGLRIRENPPQVGGSEMFYSLYAGACRAICKETLAQNAVDEKRDSGDCRPEVFQPLPTGGYDLFFMLRPTDAEMEKMTQPGKMLTVTPVAREALVFFVDARNPVNSLTQDELRKIYAGQTRYWQEVGGKNGEYILAFQRPHWTGGSQKAMLRMMNGVPLRPVIREEYDLGHSQGSVKCVAAFRCYEGALGYTFRHYAIHETASPQVKILAVDGVMPTAENVHDGTYPLSQDVVIITTGTENPHAAALAEWFLSPEGQDYVEKTGFLPL